MNLTEEYKKLLSHYIVSNNVEGAKAILATVPFNPELNVNDFAPLFAQSLKESKFEIAHAFIEVSKLNPVSENNLLDPNSNPFNTMFSLNSDGAPAGIHQESIKNEFKKLFETFVKHNLFDSPLSKAYAVREFPLVFSVEEMPKIIEMGLPLKTEYNGKKYLLAEGVLGKETSRASIDNFLEVLHKKGYDFNEKNDRGQSFSELAQKSTPRTPQAITWKEAYTSFAESNPVNLIKTPSPQAFKPQ